MKILHPDDLIEILGVCRTTAYQLCKRKDFPAHRAGKKIDIYPDELEAWRRKNTIQHRDRKPHAKTVPDAPKPVKIERKQYKTLIVVPTLGDINAGTANSLLTMEKPAGSQVRCMQGEQIYQIRNEAVNEAIKGGFERVLWIGRDIIFPPDLLPRLSEDMDKTKSDFVAGLCYSLFFGPEVYSSITVRRDGPWVNTAAIRNHEPPKSRIFEVKGTGFGCVLTSVPLLKRIKDRTGEPFTPMQGLTGELAFCWRVNQTGGKMYCDPTIKLGHIGSIEINESHYRRKKSPK